jgi:FkbM family methyltransferase
MRQHVIRIVQQWLKQRYNKQISEIKDPFNDMRLLTAGIKIQTVIDGGAYHGDVARVLADVFPHSVIHAFEPASSASEKLRAHCASVDRIKPWKVALSSSEGRKQFYINVQDSTNSLLPVAEYGERYQSWQTKNLATEVVEVTTLDAWSKREQTGSIDVIKLDLQGHELEALRGAEGALSSSVRLIYTEVEFVRIYKDNCLMFEVEAYLSRFGFQLFQLYNLTSGEDGQLVCGDAIFLQRDRLEL